MIKGYFLALALATVPACLLTPNELPPCEDAAAPNICEHAARGKICEGSAGDGIHGECNGQGICDITEWTCLRNPEGTVCHGGHCDAYQRCCSGGCLDATGLCVYDAGSEGMYCPPM